MSKHYATTIHLLLSRSTENSALPESDPPTYAIDAINEMLRREHQLVADWGFANQPREIGSNNDPMRVLDMPSHWQEGDFLQKMPPSYATLEALLDTSLSLLGKAYETMLEMGHVIRHLDEGCEHQYHWTLDGDADGTNGDIVALLRTLAPEYLPKEERDNATNL